MRHYFKLSAQPTPQLFTIHYSLFTGATCAYNYFTNYVVIKMNLPFRFSRQVHLFLNSSPVIR